MGWGNHIRLECECGFVTNEAEVALVHGIMDPHALIVAALDYQTRKLVDEVFPIPDHVSADRSIYDLWVQRNVVDEFEERYGNCLTLADVILTADDELGSTEIKCPECGRLFRFRKTGRWMS